MSRYKLILANDQGEVLESWVLDSDPQGEDADFNVPMEKMAPGVLAADINRAIAR